MARVLISYYRSDELSAGTTLCFYESLFRELERNGNDVLAVNMAYYGIFNPNLTENKAFESYLVQEAVRFSPEVIIAFNHHILRSILKVLDVPVVIYDGDELRYFADLDIVKKNIGRYKIFSIVKDWRQTYLDFGFREDQVFYMPPGTAITGDKGVKQDKPVSFLGQRRYFLSTKLNEYIQSGKDLKYLYSLYLDFVRTKNYDYVGMFQKDVEEKCGLRLNDADLWPLFDQSYLIFATLLDLGLHLGGHEGAWCDIAPFVPQLAVAHDRSRVFNLMENQDFYNSSVLSLCPMHPQAKGKGFSWRCYDIMASNACLVSSSSSELRGLTKGWVDLPMFDTPAEAREICKGLLEDSGRREELCARSREFIEKSGRWSQRFREMEQILGLSFLNPDQMGSFRKLTERPIWMEEPGIARPTAMQAPKDTQEERAANQKNLHRWERHMRLREWMDWLHKKCVNPTLFSFLCWGEMIMLAVCLTAQLGMFTVCIGTRLSVLMAWLSAFGALVFFAAVCICFFFKFLYKGVFKYAYKGLRRVKQKLFRK